MILVTGGTGMVGSHLLFQLIQSGEKVRALKRNNSKTDQTLKIFSYYSSDYTNLFSKIEWLNADLLDYNSLIEALDGVNFVYHTAAMVSFKPSDKQKMMKNNIFGTANIVNACIEKNIRKFCYVSSIAALGTNEDQSPITEQTSWVVGNKNSGYSESKFNAELEVWRGIEEGLNAVIVNPAVILGSGDWQKGSPHIFETIWKGLWFYTNGTSGFVDVRDVCSIMIKLMKSEIHSERFLLVSENYTYRNVFNQIANKLNKKQPSIYATPFLAELAWRMEAIKCKILGKHPLITKETAKTAYKLRNYSNDKIKKLEIDFISISQSISDFGDLFLSDYQKKQ